MPLNGSAISSPPALSQPGTSTAAVCPTCGQTISRATRRRTSSPASAAGPTQLDLLDGLTPGRCGPALVPASHSAAPAKDSAPPTPATYGPYGSRSSASAALQSLLASKCRQLFPKDGLTLCSTTWKERATPAGRSLPRLLASALRTSATDSGGLLPTLTAKANMDSPSMQKWPRHRNLLPTPAANSYGSNQGGAAGRTGTVRPSLETMARRGLWRSPNAVDAKGGTRIGTGQVQLCHQVGGNLNPAFVAWLMGFPVEWLFSAPSNKARPRHKKNTGTAASVRSKGLEMQSCPSSQPPSSER